MASRGLPVGDLSTWSADERLSESFDPHVGWPNQDKMGDYFDLVADRCALPRPARIARADAGRLIPPGLMSFMNESRRLVNRRMKEALGIRLRYPTVFDGVPRPVAASAP